LDFRLPGNIHPAAAAQFVEIGGDALAIKAANGLGSSKLLWRLN
jgi:hypothetical protein